MSRRFPSCNQPTIAGSDDFLHHLNVSRETIEKLETYEQLLRRWQPVQNLVAAGTLDAVWHRHFADCAQLYPLVKSHGTIVDIGAGAGLPGLVLAILDENDSGLDVHLVESNKRKCVFMRDVARTLGLNVHVHATRIEAFVKSADALDVGAVTSRALAPLTKLLALVSPIWTDHTRGVFLKGQDIDEELAIARREWSFECRLTPSITDAQGRIVEVQALTSTRGG